MGVIAKMAREQTDSTGYKPDLDLLNTEWLHVKGDIYVILEFIWDAERDLWQIGYRRKEAPPDDQSLRYQAFTRTPADFFGKHSSGESRFRRINPGKPKVTMRGVEHDGRGPG